MKKSNSSKLIIILLLSFPLLQGCVALVAGTAATGLLLAQDRRSTGTILDDQTIEIKAHQAITEASHGEKIHVRVISYNNNLLLVGQVPTEETHQKISKAVANATQVRNIHNETQILAPTSMLTRSSDSWITAKVKSRMILHKEFNPSRVKVVTEDGIVYLIGIIKSKEETIAIDIARHVKGVKKVVKVFERVPE
jgi:osmotically-inducible protein OsmY